MPEPTCALWYWSHGNVFVELCDNEQEAAESAVSLERDEIGSPAGVQFSDGRYLDRDSWPAYTAEWDRRYEQDVQAYRDTVDRPQPPTRTVVPPFETRHGQTATVLANAPSWLGRQVAPSSGE